MQISAPKPSASTTHDVSAPIFPQGQMLLFCIITMLFFIWGMSNNLTDILVQQFKKSFLLTPLEAQLVQTAVFFGYFCMALPAGVLMSRRGYKTGIVTGLCLFGTGTLMFWPAAIIAKYWLMLTALFFVGCGSATLETAANPFITQFGPESTAERRLNFAQVFNPLGTIVGVVVGTFFIFSGVELSAARVVEMKAAGTYVAYLHSEIMRVVPTYVTLGCVVLLLALVISRQRFPQIEEDTGATSVAELREKIRSLLRIASLRSAIGAQFCYCGAQIATWSAFIPYVKQYTAATERTAALYLTGNLVAFLLGRLISTSLMRWFSAARMVGTYSIVNILLLGIAILRPGVTGAVSLVLTSFFMSIMFPTIFALGVRKLGAETKLGGSLIVMAVVGGAIVPPMLGLIAKHFASYAAGYCLVVVCYAVVSAFAFRAHRRNLAIAAPVVL